MWPLARSGAVHQASVAHVVAVARVLLNLAYDTRVNFSLPSSLDIYVESDIESGTAARWMIGAALFAVEHIPDGEMRPQRHGLLLSEVRWILDVEQRSSG